MASKGPTPATAAKTKKPAVRTPRKVPAPAPKQATIHVAQPAAPVAAPKAAANQPAPTTPVVPEAPPVEAAIPAPKLIETIAAAAAPTLSEDTEIMEDTVKKTAAKAQTLFAEFNDRAKAAMEKSAKAFEEMNDFAKGNVEAVVESSKIAAKGFETIGQDAAEYGRKHFEGATAAMKSFASVKSPTDLFKLQSDYMRSAFDSLVAETSKNAEAMLKLAGDVAQPLSSRAAVAAEKIKIAA